MEPPSFSDVIKKEKELFVVDILPRTKESEEQLLLSAEHCKIIKASFTKQLLLAEEIADLEFEFAGLDNGRLRLVCENEMSRDWVIDTLPKLTDLWKDASLTAINVGAPPKLVRASFALPYPAPQPSQLFEMISRQNRSLDTKYWRVYNRKRGQNDKQNWFIGIDVESANAIKLLGFRVKFELDKIRFAIDQTD